MKVPNYCTSNLSYRLSQILNVFVLKLNKQQYLSCKLSEAVLKLMHYCNFFQIMNLILPPDPTSDWSTVRLELIAGAGGLEAAMFARDLFNTYMAYANHRGWRISSEDMSGGALEDDTPIHHIEVCVESPDPKDSVYAHLRWEAGVHRVQRVPLTSKLNKIHTSTVAVTILPVIDEVCIDFTSIIVLFQILIILLPSSRSLLIIFILEAGFQNVAVIGAE